MLTAIRLHPPLRRLALALFACALLLRALIPAGWMPEAHAGTLRLTICSGTDLSQAELAAASALLDKGQPKKTPAHKADQPCAFAGIAQAADLPDTAAALPIPHRAALAIGTPDQTAPAPGRGLAAPPPPPTGPPASA